VAEHTEERLKTVRKWIAALLQKTVGNSVTEGEAMLAAEKAAELMRKYDISLVEVGASQAFTPNRRLMTIDHAFHDAMIQVLVAIGNLCSTRMLMEHDDTVTTVHVVGEEQDAAMGQYLATVCARAVIGGTTAAAREWALFRKNIQHRKRVSFVDGMTKTLARRIDALAQERHDGTGSALVPAKLTRIDEWLDEHFELMKRSSRGTLRDEEAYELGTTAAENVALRTAIGTAPRS
jgi:hypothetical protein